MTSDPTDESAPVNRRGLIPVWAPLLVMAAVILTGVVLGGVGKPFVVLFALAAIACTAVVELRGLFLTVVLLPVYWFFGATLAGMIGNPPSTGGMGMRTAVITAAYPSIEKYLWLLVPFLICVILAVVRQRIDAAALAAQQRRERTRRRQMNEAEENNQRLNSRVRRGDRGDAAMERPAESERPARREWNGGYERPSRPAPARGERPRTTSERPERLDRSGDRPAQRSGARTRTAAELREASRRRRAMSQDQPLDMD